MFPQAHRMVAPAAAGRSAVGCRIARVRGISGAADARRCVPELNAPTVVVLTEGAGFAADEVEQNVTFPIESSVNGLPGVRRVRSASAIGLAGLGGVRLGRGHLPRSNAGRREADIGAREPPPSAHAEITPITSIFGEIMLLSLSAPKGGPRRWRCAFAEFELRNNCLRCLASRRSWRSVATCPACKSMCASMTCNNATRRCKTWWMPPAMRIA